MGVALTVMLLLPIGWMVADILLVARFLIQPPPMPKFIIFLCTIGWGEYVGSSPWQLM